MGEKHLGNRWKSFLSGMLGVIVGLMIGDIVRGEAVEWFGAFVTLVSLLLLFILGVRLYKKDE
ncbi:hypothetical protein [Virgibacillus senegalensis]|uniref:hypothetical protein n=1 Tax=Virgibacillus senegalensis TaxID=1499679 RepID=UPI00069FFEE2|nr:hypothetical protein [Virgibacillus senegalensis]